MATLFHSCFKAMYAKFKSDKGAGTPYTLSNGQWYFIEPQKNRTYPYYAVEFGGSEENDYFGKSGDDLTIIVNIVGRGREQLDDVLAMADAARTLFDGATLTFSGSDYVNYNLRPGSLSGPDLVEGLAIAALPFRLSVEET